MDRAKSKILAPALAAAVVSIATTARAEDTWAPPPQQQQRVVVVQTKETEPYYVANKGLQVGARLGYSLGAGVVYSGLKLSDASYGSIPIIVDAGWRIIPELYMGLYGQFAPVFTKTNPISCPEGLSCSSQYWRFGLEFDYHFLPRTTFDPYIGLGGGYEILHTSVNGTTTVTTPVGAVPAQVSASLIDRGWEWLAVNVGLDFRLAHWFGFGPFATATFGEYGVRTGSQSATVAGMTIPTNVGAVNHAGHELFIFGVRGTFNL